MTAWLSLPEQIMQHGEEQRGRPPDGRHGAALEQSVAALGADYSHSRSPRRARLKRAVGEAPVRRHRNAPAVLPIV